MFKHGLFKNLVRTLRLEVLEACEGEQSTPDARSLYFRNIITKDVGKHAEAGNSAVGNQLLKS